MKKWELARYLIDAKKQVDSIVFIAENIERLSHIGIREEVDNNLRIFYISLRIIIDKSMDKSMKMKLKKTDKVLSEILYEVNKNYAHKDEDYVRNNEGSLHDLILRTKAHISHVKFLCREFLPEELTLDYVSHDRKLYRLIYCITSEGEENIKERAHPLYNKNIGAPMTKCYNVFFDTEDIKSVKENTDDYAVIVEDGINDFEGLQNRQDFCIKVNVLHNLNMWCSFNSKES